MHRDLVAGGKHNPLELFKSITSRNSPKRSMEVALSTSARTQFDFLEDITNMSEGNLAAAEIQEREAVPPNCQKRKLRLPFLAGAVVLIALVAIGIELRFSRTQPIQQHSNKAAEMTVTVVHPQKAFDHNSRAARTNASLY